MNKQTEIKLRKLVREELVRKQIRKPKTVRDIVKEEIQKLNEDHELLPKTKERMNRIKNSWQNIAKIKIDSIVTNPSVNTMTARVNDEASAKKLQNIYKNSPTYKYVDVEKDKYSNFWNVIFELA